MAHVFISYARADIDFVRRLQAALTSPDREVWVDLEGIPPTADWMQEIRSAIEAADAVLFVLSPAFLASEICAVELAHAVETNKRLIPLARADLEAAAVPRPLRELNWIHTRERDDLDAAIDRLTEALDTDLERVRAHTRLLTRAIEWRNRGHDKSVLLRGRDLEEAEDWQARALEPRPSELQERFLSASRKAARVRRRTIAGSAALVVLVAAVLSGVALRARRAAEEEARQALVERSRTLAEQSRSASGELATLLALAAVRVTEPEPPITDARRALIHALYDARAIPSFQPRRQVNRGMTVSAGSSAQQLAFGGAGREGLRLYGDVRLAGVRAWEICPAPETALCDGSDAFGEAAAPTADETAGSAVFSGSGDAFAATGDVGDVARVWRIQRSEAGTSAFRLERAIPLGAGDSRVLALSGAGRWLVTAGGSDGSPNGGISTRLWDLTADPPTRIALGPPGDPADAGEARAAAFSEDDRALALAAGGTVYLWELGQPGGPPARQLIGRSADIFALAFSPDGRWLAAGPRLWDLDRMESDSAAAPLELPGHTQTVWAVAFSPDGRWLVTAGGADGSPNGGISTRLWDLAADEPAVDPIVLPHRDPGGSQLRVTVRAAAFSRPDGGWLATSISNPGIVLIWPLRVEDLTALACRSTGRDLTEAEWRTNVEDIPYQALCGEGE